MKAKKSTKIESKNTNKLLDFVSRTQEGEFTSGKPKLSYFSYKRQVICNQEDSVLNEEETNNQSLLFGISN
jgi:hypothetical protein